jgi:hypothetical protein
MSFQKRKLKENPLRWLSIALLAGLSGAMLVPGAPPEPVKSPPKQVGPPNPEKGQIRPAPNANDALIVAAGHAKAQIASDVKAFRPLSSPFTRYIWIPLAGVHPQTPDVNPVTVEGDEESFKATVLVCNYISRASFIYSPLYLQMPPPPAPPQFLLIPVDLRLMFPKIEDLAEAIRLWDEFTFDPHFSILLTKDFLELNRIPADKIPLVERKGARKGKADDGTDTLVPFEEKVSAKDAGVDVVRVDAPDLDPAAFAALRLATNCQAPIVHYQYFLFRALSTVKDDGPYRTIFGGLYYDFRGIKKAKDVKGKEKATDEDLFFEGLGIGNIAAGETYEKLLDRVRGDLRPTLFISDVTGKPRAVVGFHTPAEREGGSFGAVTWDVKDKDIDIRSHPALSQIKPNIAAQEAIFPTANGMPIFALFNGQGALQDEAPPDVVADRSIPAPHTTRLQGAISCIRCHGPTNEGWQPLKDDVGTLLRTDRLRVLGELGTVAIDSQDRITGLHTGDANRILDRARTDFAATVLRATGAWKKDPGNVNVAKMATQKIADLYGDFWYQPIDAARALAEIGLNVPAEMAPGVLTKLLDAEPQPVLGVQFEDPRLTQLAAGGKIGRRDWSLIRSFSAGMVQRGAAKLIQDQKGKP